MSAREPPPKPHRLTPMKSGFTIATPVIACVPRPVYVCIVGIKPLCGRLACQLEQIVVWIPWMPVDTIHTLEDTTRENTRATNFADTLDGAFKEGFDYHSTFRESACTIVDAGKRPICYPRGFLSSSSYGFP